MLISYFLFRTPNDSVLEGMKRGRNCKLCGSSGSYHNKTCPKRTLTVDSALDKGKQNEHLSLTIQTLFLLKKGKNQLLFGVRLVLSGSLTQRLDLPMSFPKSTETTRFTNNYKYNTKLKTA